MKLVQRVAALVAVVMFAVVLSQPAQAEGVAPAVDGVRSGVAVEGMPEFPGPHGVVAPGPSTRGTAVAPKKPKWWGLLTRGGDPLVVNTTKSGPHAGRPMAGLVIGKRYKLRGRLPAGLRDTLAGKRLRLEAKSDGDAAWTTVARFRSDRDGRFLTGFRVPKRLFGVHRYRITTTSATRQVTASTALPGGTLPAVADSSFTLTITNNAKTDLVFTFPTAQDPTSGQYGNGNVAVPQNTSQQLEFVNPIQNVTTVGFYAVRLNCFGSCSIYNANWDHAPNKKYKPCNSAPPTFSSGNAYTVRVTPQRGTSGFDMFLVDESGNVVCTGALSTKFSQWMGNHPVAKWAAIYLAADAAVNIVAIAVIGFAGEAIGAAVTTEVLEEEGSFVEIVVEETDEDGACEFKEIYDGVASDDALINGGGARNYQYIRSDCSATF